ncbi:MAG: sigma-54-dependent Fis family transcriptional regulator, partial [Roseiflexus sp.]
MGLRPGCYWSEGHAGTNAFGLALYERCPIHVVGAEHFFAQFHSLSTSAAPLYNWDGKPIGILGVACHVSVSHISTLGMVYATAKAIEQVLQADKLFSELNMQRTQLNAIVEAISEGLIMCDREGLVMY